MNMTLNRVAISQGWKPTPDPTDAHWRWVDNQAIKVLGKPITRDKPVSFQVAEAHLWVQGIRYSGEEVS